MKLLQKIRCNLEYLHLWSNPEWIPFVHFFEFLFPSSHTLQSSFTTKNTILILIFFSLLYVFLFSRIFYIPHIGVNGYGNRQNLVIVIPTYRFALLSSFTKEICFLSSFLPKIPTTKKWKKKYHVYRNLSFRFLFFFSLLTPFEQTLHFYTLFIFTFFFFHEMNAKQRYNLQLEVVLTKHKKKDQT